MVLGRAVFNYFAISLRFFCWFFFVYIDLAVNINKQLIIVLKKVVNTFVYSNGVRDGDGLDHN